MSIMSLEILNAVNIGGKKKKKHGNGVVSPGVSKDLKATVLLSSCL